MSTVEITGLETKFSSLSFSNWIYPFGPIFIIWMTNGPKITYQAQIYLFCLHYYAAKNHIF